MSRQSMIRKQSWLSRVDLRVEKFVWEEPKDAEDVSKIEVDESVNNIRFTCICFLTSKIVRLYPPQRCASLPSPARIRRSSQNSNHHALPRRCRPARLSLFFDCRASHMHIGTIVMIYCTRTGHLHGLYQVISPAVTYVGKEVSSSTPCISMGARRWYHFDSLSVKSLPFELPKGPNRFLSRHMTLAIMQCFFKKNGPVPYPVSTFPRFDG